MAAKSQIPRRYRTSIGSLLFSSSVYIDAFLLCLFIGLSLIPLSHQLNPSTEEPQWASSSGRINQFSGFVAPRPSLLPPGANMMWASIWANWSAWSFCSNGVRIRVRACNTIRGFRCIGPNQETRPCEVNDVRPFDRARSEFRNFMADYDINDPWAEDRREALRQLMPERKESTATRKPQRKMHNEGEILRHKTKEHTKANTQISDTEFRRALPDEEKELFKAETLPALKSSNIRRKQRRRMHGTKLFAAQNASPKLSAPIALEPSTTSTIPATTPASSTSSTTLQDDLLTSSLKRNDETQLNVMNATVKLLAEEVEEMVEGSGTTVLTSVGTVSPSLLTETITTLPSDTTQQSSTTATTLQLSTLTSLSAKESLSSASDNMEEFIKSIMDVNKEKEGSTENTSTEETTTTTTTTKVASTTINPLELQTIPLPSSSELEEYDDRLNAKSISDATNEQSSKSREDVSTSGEPTEIVTAMQNSSKLVSPMSTRKPLVHVMPRLQTSTQQSTTSVFPIDPLEEMRQLIEMANSKRPTITKQVTPVRGDIVRQRGKFRTRLHWGEVTVRPTWRPTTTTPQTTQNPMLNLQISENISLDTLGVLDWMLKNITKAAEEADRQARNPLSVTSTKITTKVTKHNNKNKKVGTFKKRRRVFNKRGKKAIRMLKTQYERNGTAKYSTFKRVSPILITKKAPRLKMPRARAAAVKIVPGEWGSTMGNYQKDSNSYAIRAEGWQAADDPIRLFEQISQLQAETETVEKKMKSMKREPFKFDAKDLKQSSMIS